MKKIAVIGAFALASISLPSCGDEKDADLYFTEQYSTSDANVKYEYFSPDPHCVEKMNYVTANGQASVFVLKCKTTSYITITAVHDSYTSDMLDRDESEVIGIEKDGVFSSRRCGWSVTVVDSNCLKFTFDEVENKYYDNLDYPVPVVDTSTVSLSTPDGKKGTIWINRAFDMDLKLSRDLIN